jgi:transcriptional regulator with XRE-family HTH domain
LVYTYYRSRHRKDPRVLAELGQQLKTVRQLKGLSLRAVATPAEISVAYLQKLEGGEVQQPSPNVLLRLGKALDVRYETLMELSGYTLPTPAGVLEPLGAVAPTDSFAQALNSTDLSEDERKAVAAFVAHLRDQRAKGA